MRSPWVGTFLMLSACGPDGAPWEDRRLSALHREGEIPQMEIIGESGPRVQVSETQYYYELADGAEVPDRVLQGARVWRYDGQAIFRDEAPSEGVTGTYVVPSSIPGPLD